MSLDVYAPLQIALDTHALSLRSAASVAHKLVAERPELARMPSEFAARVDDVDLALSLIPGPDGPAVDPRTWYATLPERARTEVRQALTDQAACALQELQDTLDAARSLGLLPVDADADVDGDVDAHSVDARPAA